jgi:hypothetical protein
MTASPDNEETGRNIFLEATQQLWVPSSRSAGFGRGLFRRQASAGLEVAHTLFTSPFSLPLKLSNSADEPPPTFVGAGANASVRYEFEVIIRWKNLLKIPTRWVGWMPAR